MKNIFVILFSLLFLTGCTISQAAQNNLSHSVGMGSQNTAAPFKTKQERADEIKKSILELEGIRQAVVVISGKTALIGLELTTDDEDEIRRIKEECQRLATGIDSEIRTTAVTANRHIKEMIEEIEISQG